MMPPHMLPNQIVTRFCWSSFPVEYIVFQYHHNTSAKHPRATPTKTGVLAGSAPGCGLAQGCLGEADLQNNETQSSRAPSLPLVPCRSKKNADNRLFHTSQSLSLSPRLRIIGVSPRRFWCNHLLLVTTAASGTFDPLCKVLFALRTVYLCAIEHTSVFVLPRDTPRRN